MKQGKEFGVGLFAIIGIFLFAVFVFSIGKFTGPTRKVTVDFGYVDGLAPDAPVQFAGYRVGKVESVEVLPGPPVRLQAKLSVPKDLPISRTTEVIITSMGMMGEKVVEILPAGSGDPLPDGEVLRGTDPILLSRIFGQVRSLFDESTSGNIRQVAQNFVRLTEDLSIFTTTLRRISTQNGDDIGRILTNVSEGTEHLPSLLKRMDAATADIAVLTKNLSAMSSESRPEIQQMIKNLNATSENLKGLTADVRRHPWKLIRKGAGEKENPKK